MSVMDEVNEHHIHDHAGEDCTACAAPIAAGYVRSRSTKILPRRVFRVRWADAAAYAAFLALVVVMGGWFLLLIPV